MASILGVCTPCSQQLLLNHVILSFWTKLSSCLNVVLQSATVDPYDAEILLPSLFSVYTFSSSFLHQSEEIQLLLNEMALNHILLLKECFLFESFKNHHALDYDIIEYVLRWQFDSVRGREQRILFICAAKILKYKMHTDLQRNSILVLIINLKVGHML